MHFSTLHSIARSLFDIVLNCIQDKTIAMKKKDRKIARVVLNSTHNLIS